MPTIYGIHAVKAFLKHQSKLAKALYVLEGLKSETKQSIKGMLASGTAIYTVSKKELEQKASSAMHQGVVLEVEQAHKKYQESDLASLCDPVKNPVVLVLDSVMDPHNIGACLRTANAAGIKTVIAPKDNAGDLTATAIKVASGAAPYIEWVKVANLARSLRFLQQQGYWLVGLAGEVSESLYDLDVDRPLAVVMGQEGAGMRLKTKQLCDYLVHIPQYGQVESLNVSVATGVCLFEIMRKRASLQVE